MNPKRFGPRQPQVHVVHTRLAFDYPRTKLNADGRTLDAFARSDEKLCAYALVMLHGSRIKYWTADAPATQVIKYIVKSWGIVCTGIQALTARARARVATVAVSIGIDGLRAQTDVLALLVQPCRGFRPLGGAAQMCTHCCVASFDDLRQHELLLALVSHCHFAD